VTSHHARHRFALSAVIAVFVALCVFYNAATPLFEGLDEGAHYNYVNYIATQRALPDLNSPYIQQIARTHRLPVFEADINAIGHETTQPPLYYAVGALLIAGIDRSDFTTVFKTADTMSHGLVNIHTAAELRFPPIGTVLAVRLVRLWSTLIGAVLILLVYQIAWLLMQRHDIALLASAITAFNPKFIHISSVITNDIAVACAVTLVLYMAVRLVTLPTHSYRRFILLSLGLGASIGLSALSKYSGLAALAPAGIALIWYAVRQRAQQNPGRILMGGILACGFAFGVVAGWFFVYNWLRYGDPLAWAQVQQANAFTYRGNALSLIEMTSAIPMLFRTYWGVFGDGIQAATEYDLPLWIVTVMGTCGILIAAARKRFPLEIVVLLIGAGATVVAFVMWMRTYAVTDNSRLLMPMGATVSILLAAGLLEWIPSRWHTFAAYLGGTLGVLWAIFIPTVSLLPNYNPLTYLTPAQAAQLPSEGRVLFENGIELYAVELKSNRMNAGEAAEMIAYWRATQPITQSYATVVEAFNDQQQSLGRLTTEGYLGRQFVAPEWQPGRVIQIHYRLSISASQQTLARVYVGWYSPHTGQPVRIDGKPDVSAQVATIKVRGATSPSQNPDQLFAASFGDSVQLQGYKACKDTLSLYWRSTGTPGRDYTVFVHALDAQGKVIAQSDAPVSYSTLFWDAGEQIIDVHSLPGFSQSNRIAMGMYDSETKERLPAQRPDGTAWIDNVVNLPIVRASACP
jgi:hypothetical protein